MVHYKSLTHIYIEKPFLQVGDVESALQSALQGFDLFDKWL